MIDIIQEKENIIDGTLKLLAERYPIGLYEYLFKYQTEMYKELRDLEDDISRDYLDKTVGDLKEVLREYWSLHIQAIKEFENQDDLDLKVNEINKQIQQELHAI